ncbi:MAG: DUF885 domain-containing protein [Rhodospirillaceae bacterium]|nr:DUF885 domain-containing protein [Rhodospirillaceae bacterium]
MFMTNYRSFKFALPAITAMMMASGLAVAQDTTAEDLRLNAFLDKAFDERAALQPQLLTSLGLKTSYDRLNDYTPAFDQRMADMSKTQLEAMKREFKPATLGDQAKLSYAVAEWQITQSLENHKWDDHGFIFAANGTPTSNIPVFLINNHRVDNVKDAQDYVSRIKDVERVMNEIAADFTARTDKGILTPDLVFVRALPDARSILVGAPFTDGPGVALWVDFKTKVSKLEADAATKAKLLDDGKAALTGPFKRGYEKIIATLEAVSKKAGPNEGVWRLPDGDAYYANRIKNWTTTGLTPEQVHQTGLSEVARIRKEMEKIRVNVDYKGDLQAFMTYVRTEPKFYYPNTDEGRAQYVSDAKGFIAQVMAKAPQYFNRLPKAPLDVRPVEKWREATASIAFYNRGTPDGQRPGIVYFNLADLSQTLKPHVEDVSYHEGAPGHHFQISLAQEQTGMPKIRRFNGPGAYTEGWGLYAEELAKEMGFYQDPYADFCRLASELWRASRLVVDTGMHAKRWSREKALAFLKENSLLSDLDAAREIDRYLTNPGQATSYKMGQLKIFELRSKAQKALGAKFDIKDFHDAVLADGALPLGLLEQRVDAYISRKKS